MEKPTISLCMIVKNESDLLGTCLESAKGVVDEIIVVDTGSTDHTKDIALSFGAKVYDFPWVHDFSAARNFAKEHATSQWIIQLDADEYLTDHAKGILKDTVHHAMEYALNIQIKNYNEQTKNYVLHQYPRIYRNVPEIRYHHRIHEQLLYDGKPIDTEETDVQIIHLGYTDEIVKKKNKKARNIRLLQEELRTNPKDGFMHFNLGNELMKANELKKALKHYQVAHKETMNSTIKTASILQITKALYQLKEYNQALMVLKDAKALYPDYTDLWLIEGEVYEELGREDEAKAAYQHCLNLGDAPKKYLTVSGVGTFYPINKLANLALLQRHVEGALGYLTEMTDYDKYSYTHVAKIIGLLIPMFGKEKVIEFMHETYPSDVAKDLIFKNHLAHEFRLYQDFSLLLPQTMEHFAPEEQSILSFYLSFDKEEGKEKALQFAQHTKTRAFSFVYYLLTGNPEVKAVLLQDKTCGFMIKQLEGSNTHPKKNNYKKDIYVATLNELMKLEQYETFETLIPLAPFFDPHAFLDVANLFYAYQQDDLAIEYYTKYLMKHTKDFDVYVKTARLLYQHDLYHEAMLFAEQAYKLNPTHFKPMEILLEASEKLALHDATKQLANAFLQTYPDSLYLQKKA